MQSLVSFCEQTYWYMEKHSNREIKRREWQLEYSVHLINWCANKEEAKYPFIQFFLEGPEKKANWKWCFFAPHSGADVITQLGLKNFFFTLIFSNSQWNQRWSSWIHLCLGMNLKGGDWGCQCFEQFYGFPKVTGLCWGRWQKDYFVLSVSVLPFTLGI